MKSPRFTITGNTLNIYEDEQTIWSSLSLNNMANGYYSINKTEEEIRITHKSVKDLDALLCMDLPSDLSVEKGELTFKSGSYTQTISLQAKPDLIADSFNTMIFSKDSLIYGVVIELNYNPFLCAYSSALIHCSFVLIFITALSSLITCILIFSPPSFIILNTSVK